MRCIRAIPLLALALFASPFALAETFEDNYYPPWTDASRSGTVEGAAISGGSANTDGVLQIFLDSGGEGTGVAVAECNLDFTFDHDDAEPAYLEVSYRVLGDLQLEGTGSTNPVALLVVLRNRNEFLDFHVTTGPIWKGNKHIDQSRKLTLGVRLIQGGEYLLNMAVAGIVDSHGGSVASIDFSDEFLQGNRVCVDSLKIHRHATTVTESDGTMFGPQATMSFELFVQDAFPAGADSLSLVTAYDEEAGHDIHDWRVAFTRFTESSSSQIDTLHVAASASGETIPWDSGTRVSATYWLSGEPAEHNATNMSIEDLAWHGGAGGREVAEALPPHSWSVGEAYWNAPDDWIHPLMLRNDSASEFLYVADLHTRISATAHADLMTVDFVDPAISEAWDFEANLPDLRDLPYYFDTMAMPPGMELSFHVHAPDELLGQNIYLRYSLMDAFEGGREIACLRGRHILPTSTAVSEGAAPLLVEIGRNVPNPFNPSTAFSYSLARRCAVDLFIVTPDGRRVATLAQGMREAGSHAASWDGRFESGSSAPSGLYLAVIETEGTRAARKMLLLK